MYNKDLLIKLLDAGVDAQTALKVSEQKEPEPDPEPAPVPEPEPAPEPEPVNKPDELAEIKASLAELTKLVQRQNINRIGIDTPAKNQQDRVDEMLTRVLTGEPDNKKE